MKKIILFLFLSLFIIGCAAGRFPTQSEMERGYFGEYPSDYQQRLTAIISPSLFDPYSAVYRFHEPIKFVYDDKLGYAVVVGVNAKNRLGGYVGERNMCFMFYADGTFNRLPCI